MVGHDLIYDRRNSPDAPNPIESHSFQLLTHENKMQTTKQFDAELVTTKKP